jgi:hypothetical protein
MHDYFSTNYFCIFSNDKFELKTEFNINGSTFLIMINYQSIYLPKILTILFKKFLFTKKNTPKTRYWDLNLGSCACTIWIMSPAFFFATNVLLCSWNHRHLVLYRAYWLILDLANFLLGLALIHDPLDLCLPGSWGWQVWSILPCWELILIAYK